MTRKIFNCFIICIIFCTGCSTIYRGQVVSETNGVPIANAKIVLQNNDCLPSIVINTTTDKLGFFEIEISSTMKKCLKEKFNVYLTNEKYQPTLYEIKGTKNNIIKMTPK